MAALQEGINSSGFRGPIPNPTQERSVSNLHYQLAKYMGTGAPKKLSDA
jgi:hypothetical protein